MVKKIAFWRTVGDTFNFVFGDWRRFFNLGAVWIGLTCLLFVVILVLFGPDALKPATPGKVQSFNLGRSIASLPFLVLAIVGYVAFSVAWHRAVLLGETSEPMRALRFRWREWRFLLYLIVVTALSIGVFLGALLGTGGVAILVVAGGHALSALNGGGWAWAVAILAMVVVFIAIMPFLARFSLGLPAIAVEEPEGVFGRSWHRARHNGWRLIWGPFVCSIPFSIVSGMFGGIQQAMYLIVDAGEPWRAIALLVMLVCYGLATVTHFLALAGAITFLSLSYRQLVSDETPSAPALQAAAE